MSHLPFRIVDPKLQAGRGEEFSASRQANGNADLDYAGQIDTNDGSTEPDYEAASTSQAIPQSNKGFQMLQRMGWTVDTGLGATGEGIVAPVDGGTEAGIRLGLGKQEEDDFYTASDNVQRRRLEVEVQADEDTDRTLAREQRVENLQRIKADVSTILRTFYCEVCRKQYNSAAELEIHLDSYDHHHRKRMVEMRSDDRERTKRDRDRREKRRQDKELARLNQQIQMASGDAGPPLPAVPPLPPLPPPENDSAAPPLPPADLVEPPVPSSHASPVVPPLAGKRNALQFNMGATSQVPHGVQSGLGIKNLPIRKTGKLKSTVAAFADASDEDS